VSSEGSRGDKIDNCPAITSFKGGIFEEWEGWLSINGTIEGSVKLGTSKDKVLILEHGYWE